MITIYNDEVHVFNRNENYRNYPKVMESYRKYVHELARLEGVALAPERAAIASDRKQQLANYLSEYLITESGLAITRAKIGLLVAAGITSAKQLADCKDWPKGIGKMVMGQLYHWRYLRSTKFIYLPDEHFIAKEKTRLLNSYPIQRKQLRKEIDACTTQIIQMSISLKEASDLFDHTYAMLLKTYL